MGNGATQGQDKKQAELEKYKSVFECIEYEIALLAVNINNFRAINDSLGMSLAICF